MLGPVWVDRDQGVEIVLPRERIAQGPILLQDSDSDESPPQFSGAAEPVDVLGEVGAVESADAEVDDLLLSGPAVVARDGDGRVQAGQSRCRQRLARHSPAPFQYGIRELSSAFNGLRVARIDRAHPLRRVVGGVAVRDAPGYEPLLPQGPGHFHVPRGVEQRCEGLPALAVVQQVVALGDDERHVPRDRDRPGDRQLDGAVEARGVDHVLVPAAQTAQEARETGDVEGVGGSHPVPASKADELLLREMESVHGDQDGVVSQRLDDLLRDGRLAGARRPDDPHNGPLSRVRGTGGELDGQVDSQAEVADPGLVVHPAFCRAGGSARV